MKNYIIFFILIVFIFALKIILFFILIVFIFAKKNKNYIII